MNFKIVPLALEALNYVHEIHAVLSSAATSAKTFRTGHRISDGIVRRITHGALVLSVETSTNVKEPYFKAIMIKINPYKRKKLWRKY
jgi:hypothetical protein